MISGSIPQKIRYYCRPKTKSQFSWDDIDGGYSQEVIPAFCCEADNPKTNETAKSWASPSHWDDKKWKAQIVEYDNSPIDGSRIKIIGLEHRSQGGRAYKVVIDNKYYFDFREDVLLDTILECGINKGGILNGEFIWGRVGSQMKLIRYNSELHKELLSAQKRKQLKKIPNKELVVGDLYTNSKRDENLMFLGRYKGSLAFISLYDDDEYRSVCLKKSHSLREKVKKIKDRDIDNFILIAKNKLEECIESYRDRIKKHSYSHDHYYNQWMRGYEMDLEALNAIQEERKKL